MISIFTVIVSYSLYDLQLGNQGDLMKQNLYCIQV